MTGTKIDSLDLGAAVVLLLLPQRPPLLMVDHVEGYARAPRPTLRASRALSINEPFLHAELPTPPSLPRSLLLEGMMQAAGLLQILVTVERELAAMHRRAEELVEALRNADLGYRMEPGYVPGQGNEILSAIAGAGHARVGALGASQIRFLRHVFPGETLAYEVRLVRDAGTVIHFEADVDVRGHLAAQGLLTLSKVEGIVGSAR
jgi:3-hydroxyacyl-[acyl-carrier-protein] dehydratase